MNKTINILIFLLLIILIWFLSVSNKLKVEELKFEQERFDFYKLTYQKDLVKFCQEMAATTSKESWNYKSCLKELTGIIPTFKE